MLLETTMSCYACSKDDLIVTNIPHAISSDIRGLGFFNSSRRPKNVLHRIRSTDWKPSAGSTQASVSTNQPGQIMRIQHPEVRPILVYSQQYLEVRVTSFV